MEIPLELNIAFSNFERIIQLSEKEKNIFSSLVEIIEVPKKEYILKEGQICRYEYFVLKGCLRSFYLDENAIEHTTLFAPESWWTGNLKSFVRNTPSDFYVETLENSNIFRLNKNSLDALYEKIPKFERYFRILLQNRLLATQDRIHYHLSSSATERYEKFLQKYPNLVQRVPLKYIASYLGITPTYLSRLRKKRS